MGAVTQIGDLDSSARSERSGKEEHARTAFLAHRARDAPTSLRLWITKYRKEHARTARAKAPRTAHEMFSKAPGTEYPGKAE